MPAHATVDHAIREFAAGRLVLILDDPDRENEGDLAIAAEFVTAETVNFMITHARGLVCMPMDGARLDALGLPMMVARPDQRATPFTVSVDARHGIGSGVSAADRATTARTLLHPGTRPEDLISPGHLFPLRAAPRGVLTRRGHTEAAVDLARLAGLQPAAVICEVLDEQGDPARPLALHRFARQHGIAVVTIESLVAYRRATATAAPATAVTVAGLVG